MQIRFTLCVIATVLFVGACNESPTFHSPEARFKKQSLDGLPIYQVSVDPKSNTLSYEFNLSAKDSRTIPLQQIERTIGEETFLQGTSGTPSMKEYPASEAGVLDLLVVVDNSNSMSPYQNILADRLDPLLSAIANTNWHIAVVTTDSGCLRGGKTISRAEYDADPAAAKAEFRTAISAGSMGSTIERGFYYAVEGLAGRCDSAPDTPWRRDGAHTAVLILSDEANCGSASNEGCAGDPDEFADYLLDAAPENTQLFGLLFDEDSPECPFYGWKEQTVYKEAVANTGGLWGNICEADYSPTLTAISSNISRSINFKFDLEHAPVLETLEIDLDGRVLAEDEYILQDKSLEVLAKIEITSQKLNVKYKHDPRPMFNEWPIMGDLDISTLVVKIDDQKVPETDFSLQNGALAFSTMPDEDANIVLSYRANEPLPAEFDMEEPTVATHTVKATGTNGAVPFHYEKGLIIFAQPPRDGEVINVTYNTTEELETEYKIPNALDIEIEAIDITSSGAPVQADFSDNKLVFPAEEVWHDRPIKATISPKRSEGNFKVTLPNPLRSSIEVVTVINSPCAQNFTIEDDTIEFPCRLEELPPLKINYILADDAYSRDEQ